MSDLYPSVLELVEYHNRPTALGWFRRVDRAGFHLQQLPLNEREFALLMSDFFSTFNVSDAHYDHCRYFPAARRRRCTPAKWFGTATLNYCPITLALLCEAARQGAWPEQDH